MAAFTMSTAAVAVTRSAVTRISKSTRAAAVPRAANPGEFTLWLVKKKIEGK